MKTTKIELGDIARDRMTGFEGVVVARTEWLYGCSRLTLKPQGLKDGKSIDTETFDEPQLERVIADAFERYPAPPSPAPSTGGPRPEPARGR
jgi:hypothetical protein